MGLALFSLRKASRLEDRVQVMEQAMSNRAYVTIDGHVYYQQPDEKRDAWAARVKRIMTGEESLTTYLCDTLTGCDVPGGEIEVCSPCNANPPSPQCIANHQADVDAFCRTFECENCP
jgi:hypothetical protein